MANTARTPDQAARLKLLDAKLEAANGAVSDFFRKTLYPELSQNAGSENANALVNKEKTEISTLQNTPTCAAESWRPATLSAYPHRIRCRRCRDSTQS